MIDNDWSVNKRGELFLEKVFDILLFAVNTFYSNTSL